MKKIYSLFMVLGIALCAMASSPYVMERQLAVSNSKVVNKQAKFNQQDREAIAAKRMAKATPALQVNGARQINAVQAIAKQAMPTNVATKAPAKAAAEATDTVVIVGAEWVYEYYAESGDWFMAVVDSSQTYVVRLDYIAAEENFAGSYTINDLDLDYSYIAVYDEEDNKSYVKYAEAAFTVTVSEEGKFLEANLLGDNNVRYLVSAAEYPLPDAKDTVALAYTNAELVDYTLSSEMFQFWGDENGYYTSIVMSADQVEGEYDKGDMVNAYYNYIMHIEGTDTTFIDFLDINAVVTKEDKTYNLVADALGTDTVMYHITMSYTKPAPTDTIDIVATNMVVDEFEFWGMVFCTVSASNEEYKVTLDMANGLPMGELTSEDFNVAYSSVYRIADATEIAFEDILSATVTEVDGQRAIQAQALGVDNIIYNLDLSYVLPTATDTVEIVFTTPASAEYYDSYGDYFIYNENEEYIVILDIFAEKNALEGEYEGEDFDLYYTQVGLIENGDTTGVVVAAAKATATKVSDDLVHIDAELLCENEVLYLVSTDVDVAKKGLTYDATEGSLEDEYTTEDLYTINDQSANGSIIFNVEAADGNDLMGLLFWVDGADEKTIIPTGTYPINDSGEPGTVLASTGMGTTGLTYSLYATMNEEGKIVPPCWFLVGGEVVVSEKDGILSITVDAVNSNNLPIHITCKYDLNTKQGLQYDMTEGEVNRTYSDADEVDIDAEDVTTTGGILYMSIVAANGSDMIALAFVVNSVDPAITIPTGTYPINNSFELGTVIASEGVQDGSIYPSFYGQMNATGQIKIPCYFMVGGNVVVENVDGHLKVTIDALNSYDVPAHIVYEANPVETGFENIKVGTNASKMIENDQLLIIKDGVKYNVMGSVVK